MRMRRQEPTYSPKMTPTKRLGLWGSPEKVYQDLKTIIAVIRLGPGRFGAHDILGRHIRHLLNDFGSYFLTERLAATFVAAAASNRCDWNNEDCG